MVSLFVLDTYEFSSYFKYVHYVIYELILLIIWDIFIIYIIFNNYKYNFSTQMLFSFPMNVIDFRVELLDTFQIVNAFCDIVQQSSN